MCPHWQANEASEVRAQGVACVKAELPRHVVCAAVSVMHTKGQHSRRRHTRPEPFFCIVLYVPAFSPHYSRVNKRQECDRKMGSSMSRA